MFNNFLRDLYKSKVVHPDLLQKNLRNWNISTNTLTKTFVFSDFKKAMTFATFAEGHLREKQIQSQM
jgi:pterin-4a-carbinolamine dehydratase